MDTYKIIHNEIRDIECQAPKTWCEECKLCKEHRHFEIVGKDGLTDTERFLNENPNIRYKRQIRQLRKCQAVYLTACCLCLFFPSITELESVEIRKAVYFAAFFIFCAFLLTPLSIRHYKNKIH